MADKIIFWVGSVMVVGLAASIGWFMDSLVGWVVVVVYACFVAVGWRWISKQSEE